MTSVCVNQQSVSQALGSSSMLRQQGVLQTGLPRVCFRLEDLPQGRNDVWMLWEPSVPPRQLSSKKIFIRYSRVSFHFASSITSLSCPSTSPLSCADRSGLQRKALTAERSLWWCHKGPINASWWLLLLVTFLDWLQEHKQTLQRAVFWGWREFLPLQK